MTVEEDGKEYAGGNGNGNVPNLSSISKKGLLSSLREQGDDVESTPEASTPRSNRGVGGFFASATPRSPGLVTPVVGVAAPDRIESPRSNMNKFLAPSRTFNRLRDEKEELSRLTPNPPAPHSFRDGFNFPLVGEVKPRVLVQFAKTWLRNPKNLALVVWGIGVTISGAILFMVMVGMLNHVLPHRTDRNTWFEVSNQIINALFTLMCLYLHPQRCLHLYMLIKWTPSHIIKLRTVYCKHGTRKPHEWGHMLVVVMLLQLNCFAQYALCGLNWGYKRSKRPALGVGICLSLSFGAAAAAGIYTAISPLGKDYDLVDETEELMQKVPHDSHEHQFVPRTRIYRMLERRVSFAVRDEGVIVQKAEWKGGVFDITNEPPVSILSTLCCVCVFGWNMDRLGFGNRFVHIITFVLILTAPFWIFDLAALNIQNRVVRHAIGGTGIVLCAFGLFYGGYWRIRMRERFKLPGNRFCCGKPAVTDCFQWLFFPLCSLCQEVRTAESYDVKDNTFYSRPRLGDPRSPPPGFASPHTPALSPLSAVREMPDPMSEMNLDDVELRGLESPYRESHPYRHNKSPLAAPAPVIASRESNFPSSDSPLRSSPSSPLDDPFFSRGTPPPSNRPVLGSHTSESPSRTSTSTNPFLQPELHSSGNSPLRSPLSNPSNSPSSQAHLTSGVNPSESIMRSPLLSPHRGSESGSPYHPPKLSSPAKTSSGHGNNPFLQPDTVGGSEQHF